MKKISVIIPIYNSSKYLKICLNSIINQTYKNLEIILIDDGSNDNSLEICKEFEKEDHRIKLIHQSNKGVSNVRNLGLSISTGDYLSFIDSDDYLEKECYEVCMESIKTNNCEICSFAILFEDKNGKQIYSSEGIKVSGILKNSKECLEETKNEPIKWRCCNKIIKRELIQSENIKFSTSTEQGEDGLFILNLLNSNNNIKMSYIDKALYHYVQHLSSSSHQISKYKKVNWIDTLEEYIKIYEKNGVYCDDLKIQYMKNLMELKKSSKEFRKRKMLYNLYKKNIILRKLNFKNKIKFLILKFLK